jgi:hypothetical protein
VRLLNLKGQSTRNRFTVGAGQSDALPLGIVIGFFLLPVASYFLGEPKEITIGFIILFVIVMLRRLTQGLTEDIKNKRNLILVLFNRFLYDRSQH